MSSMTKIAVRTASVSYEVEIGVGLLAQVGARVDALLGGGLTAGKQKAFVVTSPEIWKLWGETLERGFRAPLTKLSVPAGEQYKRMATVERLLEELAAAGADRDSILIAFGGGVIGDMTGFLAATYMRGIQYVQVPTTALAQIDSSIGGKTGVNLAAGKNLAGAFYHPLAVYADIEVLKTLPAAELRAGLQEAVKAGIIRDRALFDFMDAQSTAVLAGDAAALSRVVADSVRMKAEVVSADERESGERRILNFGHTIGHALEAETNYRRLLHGEAVGWGMIAASVIGKEMQVTDAATAQRIIALVQAYGPLPKVNVDGRRILKRLLADKKTVGGVPHFVLASGIGKVDVVNNVPARCVVRAVREINSQSKA